MWRLGMEAARKPSSQCMKGEWSITGTVQQAAVPGVSWCTAWCTCQRGHHFKRTPLPTTSDSTAHLRLTNNAFAEHPRQQLPTVTDVHGPLPLSHA